MEKKIMVKTPLKGLSMHNAVPERQWDNGNNLDNAIAKKLIKNAIIVK